MKKMILNTTLLGSVLVLQGCLAYNYVTTGSAQPWYAGGAKKTTEILQKYDPKTDARLRLYGQNTLASVAYENTECTPNGNARMIEVGASLREASQSFVGKAKNTSLGIPQTEYSKDLSSKKNIMYREWAAAGEQPVTVQLLGDVHLDNISWLCSISAYFTPVTGADYEVKITRGQGKCQMAVDRIYQNADGSIRLEEVPLKRCAKVDTIRSKKNRVKEVVEFFYNQ